MKVFAPEDSEAGSTPILVVATAIVSSLITTCQDILLVEGHPTMEGGWVTRHALDANWSFWQYSWWGLNPTLGSNWK